jgi:hypothetical protein
MKRDLAAILFLFTAAGCAAPVANPARPVTFDCAAVQLAPVTDPAQRFDFATHGFSVLPPRGEHWCIFRRDARGVQFTTHPLFGKKLERRPSQNEVRHTVAMIATVVEIEGAVPDRADTLRAFVEQWLASGGPTREAGGKLVLSVASSRGRRIEAKVVADDSLNAACARYDAVMEERDNPRYPGTMFVVVFRSNYLCRHPVAPDPTFIWVGYSERYVQASETPPLVADARRDEIELFARSLLFAASR